MPNLHALLLGIAVALMILGGVMMVLWLRRRRVLRAGFATTLVILDVMTFLTNGRLLRGIGS